MTVIECPVCGEEHPPGAYRCDECGRDLVSVDRDDDGGSMPLVTDGGQPVDGTEYHDPEDSACTDFKVRDGFVDEEGEPVFVWSFKCTRCGKQTPCKGNPTGFGGRPYSCSHCGWVSLLVQDAIESFADEHYVDADNDQKLATDGGRDVEQFYVVNESRSAVVDGPFESKTDARQEASDRGPEHIVATEGALEMLALTSNATIRWENDDVDLVTDGGITGPSPQPEHPKPERFGRNKAFLGPERHLCDECGRVFDELQELAYHDCALLPDGGVVKFERQDVEAVRREGDRVDQGPCPHTDPGDELPCASCFVDGILGGDR